MFSCLCLVFICVALVVEHGSYDLHCHNYTLATVHMSIILDLMVTGCQPDDNMGVNLAELSMSVFGYPMGATIGCGLQKAHTFPPKKALLAKNTAMKLCNVSHKADSSPSSCILLQKSG